jgi:NitT/TauT family transport system permease protein
MDAPIIPYPHLVLVHTATSLMAEHALLHLLFSLYRMLMGLAIALCFAIPTGMVAGRMRSLDHIISPLLYLLYPLPKIAFLPVFMVLFGIGDLSKIMLIATIVFFPAAVTIRDGVREIPGQFIELARACHLTPRQVIEDIIWPAILPRIFSSLRITAGIALSVLFISENFATTYGLGYHIMNNWVMANYIGMYSGIVLLSLLGLGLYLTIDFVERLAIPQEAR